MTTILAGTAATGGRWTARKTRTEKNIFGTRADWTWTAPARKSQRNTAITNFTEGRTQENDRPEKKSI